MNRVVHFGAGNIGRGFIGNLLSRSGYHVVFADVSRTLIPALRDRGRYEVEEVGESRTVTTVAPVSGLFSDDPALLEEIAGTGLITTAVGPKVLPIVAGTIAAGLRRRVERGNVQPLNIIACENMIGASTALGRAVRDALDEETWAALSQRVGFPNSAVDRIVPPMPPSNDPLLVRVEEFSEWIVDQNAFVGDVPAIAGMQLTSALDAFIERKLFTLNTGHAVAAYLGTHFGHTTIGEAVADERVAEVVVGAMRESGAVLVRRHGFDPDRHEAYVRKVVSRFHNSYLIDDVTRVGRQPARKLSPSERLIRPLRGTMEYGLPHGYLVQGIAAALAFRHGGDPEAVEIASAIETGGIDAAIERYTGIGTDGADGAVAREIRERYEMYVAAESDAGGGSAQGA